MRLAMARASRARSCQCFGVPDAVGMWLSSYTKHGRL
jgi:hypothetical protein